MVNWLELTLGQTFEKDWQVSTPCETCCSAVRDRCEVCQGVIILTTDFLYIQKFTRFLFVIGQEPEDLFETISQAMLNAVDRDAVSGMGVVVHVM